MEDFGDWPRCYEGQAIGEDSRLCALDALTPENLRAALGDHPELQTYQQRRGFVERRLGMVKHRALAQLTSQTARVPMGR